MSVTRRGFKERDPFKKGRSVPGSSGSRSYTGYPATFSRRVSRSIPGIGWCQFAHNDSMFSLSAGGSFAYRRASLSEHGNDSCHIVLRAVNGMA